MSKQSANRPTAAPDHHIPVIRIEPAAGWASLQLGELWAYRELLYFLTWRDIKVRYKQTVLGASWAIIQPLFTMIVFSIFFGRLAGLDSNGLPYTIFSYSALVLWTFFANSLSMSSNSLVGSANLIKKVYFPRLAAPIATVAAGLVDFALAFALLLAMMVWYGIAPTINVLFLPLFVLMAVATALGAGLWLSALNVQFRDIRYIIPFVTQIWMFATPVAYASRIVPERWRTIYGINPMVGIIDGFRWSLLGTESVSLPVIGVSALAALALLISGAFYFRRMEKNFADVV